MDELYQALVIGCSEQRAKTLCKLKSFLDACGYEDYLIIHLDYLVINQDIPDRSEKLQLVIIDAGISLLMENGVEVDAELTYNQPYALYNMVVALNQKIDEFEDYEALLEVITDGGAFELATVIAYSVGDKQPTRYSDLIVRVQDRVYDIIKEHLEQRIKIAADGEDIERIPQRIVDMIKVYVERFPTNQMAELFTTVGIDVADEILMGLIDYEFEPAIPKPYYHNIAVAIVGLIIRGTQYYSDGYPLIERYAAQLVESDGAKDMLSVCREANEILKMIHDEVDNDEEA